MKQFRLAAEATADLDEIWNYHVIHGSEQVADKILEIITAQFSYLARNPFVGVPRSEDWSPDLRSLAVSGYIIIHRVEEDDTVVILRVIHGKRDIRELLVNQFQ
jgi:toxin ParE1/3/4